MNSPAYVGYRQQIDIKPPADLEIELNKAEVWFSIFLTDYQGTINGKMKKCPDTAQ